jgi:hypothetical protein
MLCLVVACSDRNIDLESDPSLVASGDAAMTDDTIVADPAWSCLGEARPYPTPNPQPAVVVYDTTFGSFVNPAEPPGDLALRVCLLSDAYCSSPLQEVTSPVRGAILMPLELPFGFHGYLRLDAPAYASAEYYLGGPMLGDSLGEPMVRGEPIAMLDFNDISSLFAAGGLTADPLLGMVVLRAVDCEGRRAPGVQLSVGAGDVPWVLVNGLPVFSEAPRLSTDASGIAGFVNLPPGNLLIEGHITATGATYGTTALRVKAGTITMAEVRPDYVYGR